MVRNYLRQGGRDAYASHEGVRSIMDMDLEHIRSLKAAVREGGADHPDNVEILMNSHKGPMGTVEDSANGVV